MHVNIAKLPSVQTFPVDFMIFGHTKDTKVRHVERTLWEWDDPKVLAGNKYSPLQDDDPFDPNDVIDPDLLNGGCDSSSNPGSDYSVEDMLIACPAPRMSGICDRS
eukprot:1730814-Heterocapsa_arctica.AAC.1